MPNLDGFEAALAIRALEAASSERSSCRSDADCEDLQRPSAKKRRSTEPPGGCPQTITGVSSAADCGLPCGQGGGAARNRIPIFAITCSTDDELWQRPVLHGRCTSPSSRAGSNPNLPYPFKTKLKDK